jgi:hypothetical protein
VYFENPLDIEIEAIAYNFDIDISIPAISEERGERRVDIRMVLDKTKDRLLIPLKDFCDSAVGLSRTDLAITEIPIDRLPIPGRESIEKVVPHIPGADRSVKITKNQFFHFKSA